MIRSIVKLPADAGWEFEVYVNGVQQEPGVDFYLDARDVIFCGSVRRDNTSRRGTVRQDDTVDIRYQVYGEIRLKRAAAITLDENHDVATYAKLGGEAKAVDGSAPSGSSARRPTRREHQLTSPTPSSLPRGDCNRQSFFEIMDEAVRSVNPPS